MTQNALMPPFCARQNDDPFPWIALLKPNTKIVFYNVASHVGNSTNFQIMPTWQIEIY
jgi:hypothetical protein